MWCIMAIATLSLWKTTNLQFAAMTVKKLRCCPSKFWVDCLFVAFRYCLENVFLFLLLFAAFHCCLWNVFLFLLCCCCLLFCCCFSNKNTREIFIHIFIPQMYAELVHGYACVHQESRACMHVFCIFVFAPVQCN